MKLKQAVFFCDYNGEDITVAFSDKKITVEWKQGCEDKKITIDNSKKRMKPCATHCEYAIEMVRGSKPKMPRKTRQPRDVKKNATGLKVFTG